MPLARPSQVLKNSSFAGRLAGLEGTAMRKNFHCYCSVYLIPSILSSVRSSFAADHLVKATWLEKVLTRLPGAQIDCIQAAFDSNVQPPSPTDSTASPSWRTQRDDSRAAIKSYGNPHPHEGARGTLQF